MVRNQPGQIVCETLCKKKNITKKGWWSGSGEGSEFKLQYCKKKKKKKN
jgi:hypothetical protein